MSTEKTVLTAAAAVLAVPVALSAQTADQVKANFQLLQYSADTKTFAQFDADWQKFKTDFPGAASYLTTQHNKWKPQVQDAAVARNENKDKTLARNESPWAMAFFCTKEKRGNDLLPADQVPDRKIDVSALVAAQLEYQEITAAAQGAAVAAPAQQIDKTYSANATVDLQNSKDKVIGIAGKGQTVVLKNFNTSQQTLVPPKGTVDTKKVVGAAGDFTFFFKNSSGGTLATVKLDNAWSDVTQENSQEYDYENNSKNSGVDRTKQGRDVVDGAVRIIRGENPKEVILETGAEVLKEEAGRLGKEQKNKGDGKSRQQQTQRRPAQLQDFDGCLGDPGAFLDLEHGRTLQPGEVETGMAGAVDAPVPAYAADPSKTPFEQHQAAVKEAGRILSEKEARDTAAATTAQFAALDDLAATARDTLSRIRAPKPLKERWENAIKTYCGIRAGTWLQCEGQDVVGDLQKAAKEIDTFAKSKNQALEGGHYANMVAGKRNQGFHPRGRGHGGHHMV